jgi:(1->4)-alpha-D-glucan 1-alpha-D-glucosylmutase
MTGDHHVSAFDPTDPADLLDPGILASVAEAATNRPPPRATYRMQFNAGFTFRDATKLVPYLADLGISHLYASPIFTANPGSTHGYDVTDYNQLNPEIGTREELDALVAALHEHGLKLIVDFVPNHMGVAAGLNEWWQDVLENGPSSPYAAWFDIDWQPLKPELDNKVLLPFLGDQFGVVLENGELKLRLENGAFTVWYYSFPLPIAPPTYGMILRAALPALGEALPPEELILLEFASLLAAFERLPGQTEQDPELISERRRDQTVAKARLADLLERSSEIGSAVDDAIRIFNGAPGNARSFDPLDALLEAQSYRLAFWRVAAEEINYRRFFAINELAAIRQEEPAVFAASHQLLLDLIGNGSVDGVRIDHLDGLWDPERYLRDLQRSAFAARYRFEWSRRRSPEESETAWPDVEPALSAWWDEHWTGSTERDRLQPIYLVIEKILGHRESLPADWATAGTVGYDFMTETTQLFVDSGNVIACDRLYHRFTGMDESFSDLAYEKKQLILRAALASEVAVLARVLDHLTEHQRRTRDFTLNNLRYAMREVIACFPIYRTYLTPDTTKASEGDRWAIETAIREAKRRNPDTDPSVFAFIRRALLMEEPPDQTEAEREDRVRFAMKFQQLTGPVMAKGIEDTVFYIFNRLTSLNEVGGEPAIFGLQPGEVHENYATRRKNWPDAMLSSSTHDTKRSADVRARISTLSEMPREWRAAINRWSRFNRKHRTRVEGSAAPSRNDEYLLYQTLLGAWPIGLEQPDDELRDRILAYLDKATREAQVNTSWTNPNEAYDAATATFIRAVLDPKTSREFLGDFATMRTRVCRAGLFTALSQQILKLTAPGVPDIYQGTELWDFSLVDPDNRRPVDYPARVRQLKALDRRKPSARLASDLAANAEDGRIKLYLTAQVLRFRAEQPELFARGTYQPLVVTGERDQHVFAFAREYENRQIVVIAPRLIDALLRGDTLAPVGRAVWGDTAIRLPDSAGEVRYRNLFTGERITTGANREANMLAPADALAHFPVALLVRDT